MKSVVSEASRRFKISSDERLVTVQFWREEDVALLVVEVVVAWSLPIGRQRALA